MTNEAFLFRRISTSLAFAIIFFLSTLVGTYCIWQSQKLKALETPLAFYPDLVEIERPWQEKNSQ